MALLAPYYVGFQNSLHSKPAPFFIVLPAVRRRDLVSFGPNAGEWFTLPGIVASGFVYAAYT